MTFPIGHNNQPSFESGVVTHSFVGGFLIGTFYQEGYKFIGCTLAKPSILPLRPVQVPMEKVKRSLTVDRMRTDKPFDLCAIADTKLGCVKVSDFGEFKSNPFIRANTIEVSPLDHERPWTNQGRHFGVIERTTQIKFIYLVFSRPHVTKRVACGGIFDDPFVEVR